ncbi:MAG: SLC13 family permease, partial [Bacteroidales bacterium]|nr:SLC13 family permease [Bacteroidales bacterium]
MEYFQIFLVIAVILYMVISLYAGHQRTIVVYAISITLLGLFGIISTKEILQGFANEQIAVILLLIIIGNVIHKSGLIDLIFNPLFKNVKTTKSFLRRLLLFVSSFSAIFNNAPLVAMLMPYINNWAVKNNVNQSKLLIPLSYAAILGGSATLIGTSTNLLINGMLIETGSPSLGIFEFSYVGLPMIVLGISYLLTAGVRILPDRPSPVKSFGNNKRDYLVEVLVTENSPLHTKTVEHIGLRNLKGLFLVEIIRDNYHLSVSPKTIIYSGDKLIFAGETKEVIDLIDEFKGLELPQGNQLYEKKTIEVVEVVVSPNSSLQGNKVKLSNFRSKFDAVIVAVHRNGERLSGKIGDIVLRAGDVLLLYANKGFFTRVERINDFYLINKLKENTFYKTWQRILLLLGLILVIVLSALKIIALFKGLMAVLIFILIFKIAGLNDLKNSLDLNLLGIAAMSLALGKALINSGLAEVIAKEVVFIFQTIGVIPLLVALFIITSLVASF